MYKQVNSEGYHRYRASRVRVAGSSPTGDGGSVYDDVPILMACTLVCIVEMLYSTIAIINLNLSLGNQTGIVAV